MISCRTRSSGSAVDSSWLKRMLAQSAFRIWDGMGPNQPRWDGIKCQRSQRMLAARGVGRVMFRLQLVSSTSSITNLCSAYLTPQSSGPFFPLRFLFGLLPPFFFFGGMPLETF